MAKAFSRILFIAYSAIMLWLLFGQRFPVNIPDDYFTEIRSNINLIPFHTIYEYFTLTDITDDPELLQHAFINLAGNVVMFIPLGFFLTDIRENLRHFPKHIICTAMIILAIEAIQLFTLLGSFDIDDILLNTVGSAIGYGIWKLFIVMLKKKP